MPTRKTSRTPTVNPPSVLSRTPTAAPAPPVARKPLTITPLLGNMPMSRYHGAFRTLSIDGGGARGMIPAVILKEIERRSGKRIHQLFDRICGTSTGSILACGLTAPKTAGSNESRRSAREIVELYRSLGERIFSRGSFNETVVEPIDELLARSESWIATHPGQTISTIKDVWNRITAPLHDVNKLAYELHQQFGDLKMEDALCELFVYAYDIGSRTPEILGSSESTIPGARNYSKFKMYQTATASSAAVPFFAPYTVYRKPTTPVALPSAFGFSYLAGGEGDNYQLVDGGNGGIGSPAMLAFLEESEKSRGRTQVLVSLGTGHSTAPVPSDAKTWGFLQWIGEGGELLKSVFDGEADATDQCLRKMLAKDVTYFRWQPSIPESFSFLDEGSREDMGALEDLAQAFISEHDEDIDTLIACSPRTA
jgi:uncharacterized protein